MFENVLRILPLVGFLIIISLVFYQILLSTKNVFIVLSILFAFYIIFRYVMTNVVYIYDKTTFPIVTKDELDKYRLENDVELRELAQVEHYQKYCDDIVGCKIDLKYDDNPDNYDSDDE